MGPALESQMVTAAALVWACCHHDVRQAAKPDEDPDAGEPAGDVDAAASAAP